MLADCLIWTMLHVGAILYHLNVAVVTVTALCIIESFGVVAVAFSTHLLILHHDLVLRGCFMLFRSVFYVLHLSHFLVSGSVMSSCGSEGHSTSATSILNAAVEDSSPLSESDW